MNLANHLLTHDTIRSRALAAHRTATEAWHSTGLPQVVDHRGYDAQAARQSWSEDDPGKIRRLASMGFALSITGGFTIDDLPLFAGLPVKVFIAPAAARAFEARTAGLWS